MTHSCNDNPYNLYALHGFLGRPGDWSLFPGITHKIKIEHTSLSLDEWAKKFNQSIVNHPDKKNILMGYSMGGRLAMHALIDNPNLWDAAIIIAGHPGLESPEERNSRIESDRQWSVRFQNGSWDETLNAWNHQPLFGNKPFPLPRINTDFSRQQLSDQLLNWSLGKQAPLVKPLANLSLPFYYLTGEHDSKFYDLAEQFKPFAKVLHIPDSFHRAPWEQPVHFTHQLTNIIQELL